MHRASTFCISVGTLRMWPTATPARTLAARVLLLIAAAIVFAIPAQATVPATMSYQGVLRDAGGTIPPDDEYPFVFCIYNAATGGSLLWQESQDLLVTGGLFNAILGAVTPFNLPFDVPYWLETTVNGSTLSPRVQLASSPYAQRAAVAEALAGGGGSGIGGGGTVNHLPKFTGATTVGNSMVYEIGSRVGMGTTNPRAALHVENISGGPALVLSEPNNNWLDLWTGNSTGVSAINIKRGGSYVTSLTESAEGFYVSRTAVLGGIVLSSIMPDPSTAAAVSAKYTGTSTADYAGLYGESAPSDFYGYGGKFRGGFTGAYGLVQPTGYDYYFGLRGDATGGSGTNYGVYGLAVGSGVNYGVYGHTYGGSANYAGMFYGDVHVSNNLTVGGSKSFRIDHPLDPANKYLNHFCVESDRVLNTYTDTVVLDGAGEAWVELADWFDALNRDPHYQLTCVGGFAPVYVAEKITGNRFKIAGGTPGLEVSWQVTAVRSDPTIAKHRLPVEQDKPAAERGKYLEPELYGASETERIGRVHQKQEPNH
jgi:hypothetical protein